MKRSVVIGVTALVAGLLLAFTAFAAPFRGYDRAAGDQYTTTTPTTSPGTTVTIGQTVTLGSNVSGQGSPTTSTTSGPTTGAGVAPSDDDGNGSAPGEDDGSGAAPDEDSGSGAAPDEDSGAGLPLGSGGRGGGTTGATARGTARSRIAFLSIGAPPKDLSLNVLRVIGIPQWSGLVGLDVGNLDDAAAGTPFAGIDAGDVDLAKLRGFAKLLGADTVTATGLSSGLPDLLTRFDGSVEPITGLVIARKRLSDADDRAVAEAFQRSFARGAVRADIPVVGVELTNTDPSSIAYFKTIKGVSSVDNLDARAGRESLARLLAGARPGHYGTQDSASAAQPPRISPASASDRVFDGGGSLSGSPLLVGLLLTMALLGGRAFVTVVQRSRA